MCHFITMIFPPSSKFTEVASTLARHHRRAEIIENPHLASVLVPGELYIQPATKTCDCGTSLGFLRPRSSEKRPERSVVDGLRRKGWSVAKIDRWLAQREEVKSRNAKSEADRRSSATGTDPDGWTATTSELLALPGVSYAGILLHHYSGSLEGERIAITGRTKLICDESLSDALYHIEEDRIYEIHRQK